MSYIQRAKDAQVTAEKAAAFDDMQKRLRERDVYELGGKDAYMSVEQELVRRAAQNRQARQSPERRYGSPDSLVKELGTYTARNQYPSGQGLATSLVP